MDFKSDGFVDAKRPLWEANFKTKFVDFESDGFVDTFGGELLQPWKLMTSRRRPSRAGPGRAEPATSVSSTRNDTF